MTTTHLTHINAALTRTGNAPITSLDDGSAASVVATQNYEAIVTAELSKYPWRWAAKTQTLNLLAGTPAPPWQHAYQRPTDVLLLRVVEVDGEPIDYEVQFDKVLCDASADAQVIAKYTWRPSEPYWPGWFAEALTQRLEALFLRALREDFAKADARDGSAENAFMVARRRDAQQQTPARPYRSDLLDARRR